MIDWIVKASPVLKARLAGALYVVSVLTAVFNEFIVRGRLGLLGIVIPISCQIALTLLLYDIFTPVNRSVALLAVSSNLVCLTFEALRWQPYGVNIAIVFHGFYCLLMGYLIARSAFLPRILGVMMALAGLLWLTCLSPSLAKYLASYRTTFGIVGEASLMLWLLTMGVNAQRWKEQASVQGHDASQRAMQP